MFVISVNTRARLLPVSRLARHLPTVEDAEQAVALVAERPELPPLLGVFVRVARSHAGRAVDGLRVSLTIARHHAPGFERALVAREQVVQVHRARVDVLD